MPGRAATIALRRCRSGGKTVESSTGVIREATAAEVLVVFRSSRDPKQWQGRPGSQG